MDILETMESFDGIESIRNNTAELLLDAFTMQTVKL